MTLLDEIKAKCPPDLLASQDADAIAAVVNVGRTSVVSRLGGIGAVLETLGVVDGPWCSMRSIHCGPAIRLCAGGVWPAHNQRN